MLSRCAAVIVFLFCISIFDVAVAAENVPLKLKLGMAGIEPGLSGVWMAKEKGFFEEEDITVELVNFNGGSEGIFAVASGDLPVTVVGGPSAARGAAAGLDIKFVAELLDYLPYSLFVSSKINTPADLAGKRFAITSFGGTTDFVTRLILDRLKVETGQASFLLMGDEPNRLAALQADSADAAVLQPPCSTIARKLGFKELPGGNAEGISGQQDFLVASGRTLVEHRDMLLRVLRAIIKGSYYFKAHPDEGRLCVAKYLQIEDPEGLTDTYETYRKLLTRNGSVNRQGIQRLLDFIGDERSRAMKPEDLLDLSLVDELEKNGDIERISKQ
jgi:NitT/TauT family transport system substrate-binding protein